MRRERLVFWLGEPSPHQSGWLDALPSLLPRCTLIAVFQRPLQKQRLAMGWRSPDTRMHVVMSPDRLTIEQLAVQHPRNSVHIFGGMRLPMIGRALRTCARSDALMGVASEARSTDGSLGKLRLFHSRFVERPYRSRMDFVLAIGPESVRWYERCGYPRERIFPWAYVAERPAETAGLPERDPSTPYVISYVGRCDERKGIDTLLRALARLRTARWLLQVIGDGPHRRDLQALVEALALADRVRFVGTKANREVWRLLGETDVLVLPSLEDGWGAVVNEALMSGTPVVCSDRCGAADLLRSTDFGETFEAGSPQALAGVLRRRIAQGPLPADRRREIREWSSCIEGEALARYLVGVVEHVDERRDRPLPPWLGARALGARLRAERARETPHAYLG